MTAVFIPLMVPPQVACESRRQPAADRPQRRVHAPVRAASNVLLEARLPVGFFAKSQITAFGKSLDWGLLLYRYERQCFILLKRKQEMPIILP